jgi:hypothetical protein
MIIIGYLVRGLFTQIPFYASDPLFNLSQSLGDVPAEFAVIGYVIPGLIAIWMDRQGVLETLAALVTSAVVVRLALMLVFGQELQKL